MNAKFKIFTYHNTTIIAHDIESAKECFIELIGNDPDDTFAQGLIDNFLQEAEECDDTILVQRSYVIKKKGPYKKGD